MTDLSELRQDPFTGTFVAIAAGRAKRPMDLARVQVVRPPAPPFVDTCPFCRLDLYPQKRPTLALPRGRRWQALAFPNKFPAFVAGDRVHARKLDSLYTVMDAVGAHEVIITRAHDGFLFRLGAPTLLAYVRAWRDRHRALMVKPSVAYLQLIENHGPASGGSVEHSHVQLFGTPFIPRDALQLLRGAERHFAENGSCVLCDILAFESKNRERVVWESEAYAVLCPFAARVPHEQWVVPKAHGPGFEALRDADLTAFARALQTSLRALAAGFRDPAYNLIVYSAPCDTEGYVCDVDEFSHFHWHARILPRLNVWGGLELATGLEVHSAVPEATAAFLRSQIP